MKGLLSKERDRLHSALLEQGILSISKSTYDIKAKFDFDHVASNADAGQKSSIQIANLLIAKVAEKQGMTLELVGQKKKGQSLGNLFEGLCSEFVYRTFNNLDNIRPGRWLIEKVGARVELVLGRYEQYSHLAELNKLANQHDELRNFLGDGYTVSPDIIIARYPESDSVLNGKQYIVDDDSCLKAMLRLSNHTNPSEPALLLHASISCKFTMRSDRAQNTRTEALNLLRARKGRAPHIVSVTAEPTASRIASLALGTGDIDCVYHFALYELIETLEDLDKDSELDLITSMVEGKRLKDISDLPLDLVI